jgi:3-hydroxyisobutyrate dehydrogenase
MAENVFHMGPVGAGSATKLANQLITFSALAGVGEALRLAGEFDVREEDVLRAVATGTGDTWIGRNWGFYDRLASDYDRIGTPVWQRPWSKDLWDVVAAGRESRLALPVAGLLAQIMAETVEDHAHASELGVVQ